MGDVYKAYDRRLERTVALKVLRHLGRKSFERFLREAKSQAKVEHENICKVYEADVVGGIPYIVMQFIDGGTLKDLANRLTLRQKLLVLRDVARAVHTAHGFGIIHRDLKPANIMMREIDPDTWKPYVMDFGLARSQAEPGVTATGSLLGTVRFMSPEQARGQTRSLDQRSDIYSLGATLYYTIAGRSPVDGSNFGEILAKLTRENPIPLRHFDPTLPPDLDYIVSKCLAKKPQHRYASAKDLADDLDHLVSGEPISARRRTIGYLLGKKIRKHKIASWAIGAAVFVILVSAAWTGVTLWRANTRAQLARDFGRKVERIDAVARYAHMLPQHDILVEYRFIEDMMAQIKQQMRSVGKLGEGSGHYALGRGFLALGDDETALSHLEKAWDASYRDEEVAYALGLVRARLFLKESRALDGIKDPKERSARKQDIERRHRDPSLAYLKLATQSGFESPQFVESLIAFQERRFDAALLKADQAIARTPWLYEAIKLKGNINVLNGSEKVLKGDLAEAVSLFREAEEQYQQALAIAGSDPDIYLRMADLWQLFMIAEIYSTGGDIEQYKNKAVAACEAALAIHAKKAEAHRLLVDITMRWNEYLFHRSMASPESLNRALEYAQGALALDPDDGESLDALGTASVWLGIHLEKRGEDPTQWFKKAEAAYLDALARTPAKKTHIKLGLTYQHFGTYAVHLGRSPVEFAKKALYQFEQALNLDPGDTNAIVNLGNTHYILAQAQWLQGQNPEAHFKQAIARMRRVLELNPKHTFSRANLGSFLEHLSRFYMSFGKDPVPLLEEAEQAITQCAQTHKNYYQIYEIFAAILASRASWEAHLGNDPRPWVDRTIQVCETALAIDPNSVKARVEGARAWRVAKGWSAMEGKPYSLKKADQWLRQGLQQNPSDGSLLQASARNRLFNCLFAFQPEIFCQLSIEKGHQFSKRSSCPQSQPF